MRTFYLISQTNEYTIVCNTVYIFTYIYNAKFKINVNISYYNPHFLNRISTYVSKLYCISLKKIPKFNN